jgi:hypothetical protein
MLKTHPKAKAVIGKLPLLAVLQIFLQKVPPPIRSATLSGRQPSCFCAKAWAFGLALLTKILKAA